MLKGGAYGLVGGGSVDGVVTLRRSDSTVESDHPTVNLLANHQNEECKGSCNSIDDLDLYVTLAI